MCFFGTRPFIRLLGTVVMEELIIIGGGLAGSEAAWQAANRGVRVTLYEMRPGKCTEAHKTGLLGELVCSNSLRSKELLTAPGLLKHELEAAGSLILKAAKASEVPAGSALAVDRTLFAGFITAALSSHKNITIKREEIRKIPAKTAILATGPLTSSAMAEELSRLLGQKNLYFYDAIAPIIASETIDSTKVYRASRYGKGGEDYINCPMDRESYQAFYDTLLSADTLTPRDFEDNKIFEGCMPIEVMASRGKDTLRFGPMKPVGLKDPGTGREPYAVVQLRSENRENTAYNMVGFQTRLRQPEQKRVFSLVPGLENAEFLRWGSLHRNTFINGPLFLGPDLTLKTRENLYMAGQITGVEGYIESTAMGLVAGINAAGKLTGREALRVPSETAHGSLIAHITTVRENFQPSNINFGLFPASEEILRIRDKRQKRGKIIERAIKAWEGYLDKL